MLLLFIYDIFSIKTGYKLVYSSKCTSNGTVKNYITNQLEGKDEISIWDELNTKFISSAYWQQKQKL